MKTYKILVFLLCFCLEIFAQYKDNSLIKGMIVDSNSKQPLMYATVFILNSNTGVISNEHGQYTIEISSFGLQDSVRFQYMGYQIKDVAISDLLHSADVHLEKNIINISETLIFGNEQDPEFIVQQVLLYADSNYHKDYSESEIFVRKRDESDLLLFKLDYKKSNISDIDQAAIAIAEQKTPRYSTSFTDFLGEILISPEKSDSLSIKIKPKKVVSLKDKDITEIDQLAQVFEDAFKKTDSLEYWKIKTGIIGSKVGLDFQDTTLNLEEDEMVVEDFANNLYHDLSDYQFDNEDMWDFLYKPFQYSFNLVGGTRIQEQDIYIIDFSPKNKGLYEGRLYISLSSYAMLRADFHYAEGKHGRNFKLMGINYKEETCKISINFEKIHDHYYLKYFSLKKGSSFGIDRKIALLKKRKKPLFDKTLLELKGAIDIQIRSKQSIECLLLSHEDISPLDYHNFEQVKKMKVTYVEQFDDSLWQGYDIVEPTKQMREYKKISY
tara:strand:+ start:8437 stop:9921 length:1485 start_codon:yes stop_codon:yes gene_type:complete